MILKPEKQVCSPELSKKLKKLGVRQDGYFWWVKENSKQKDWWTLWDETAINKNYTGKESDWVSAFTVAELGEMLPVHIPFPRRYNDGLYWCEAVDSPCCGHDSLADGAASMLIHLLENKLIPLPV